MTEGQTAIVTGVGPGLGAAIARRFASAGMKVAVSARNPAKIDAIAKSLADETGATVVGHAVDVTDEAAVVAHFAAVEADWGTPDVVVFNASGYGRRSILEATVEEFEANWRAGCLGGFIVGREAAKAMAGRGSGSILFTGATASVRGSARFFNFASSKFALRALTQSMARELGPLGIHVAHVLIDGEIRLKPDDPRIPERDADALLDPDSIAELYYQLHTQERSCWTLETDVRPSVESF
jgi:NAD(P)-dependent dehydrogenase (short-subunit alcohol dehydrogenase family)